MDPLNALPSSPSDPSSGEDSPSSEPGSEKEISSENPVLDGLHGAWHPHVWLALGETAHTPVRVPREGMPLPQVSGFIRHRGLYFGQIADWRFSLEGKKGVHVREFEDRYELHWDRVCPLKRPVRHLVFDTPWLAASTAVVALALPALWRRSR